MQKIKVLFSEIYHDGTVGGSHSVLFNLIKTLDKERFEPSVLFYGDNIYVEKIRELGVNVDVFNLGLKSRSRNVVFRKLYNLFYQKFISIDFLKDYLQENRVDVLFVNNTLYTASNYVLSSAALGIPSIVYERGVNSYSKSEVSVSDRIFASVPVSDAVKKSLVDQKLKSRRIQRIYDGIDFDFIVPKRGRGEVLTEFGIPEGSQIAGIVGNIKFWKGQAHFIDAVMSLADDFPDLFGVIIGGCADRDEAYFDEIKGNISSAGLEDRFVFTGYREDIPDILGALDVFVHASTRPEPFGMVIPEAMAARKPVVATNFGGPLESLDYGKCGILVPPCDGPAIAQGIRRYLTDPEFRDETVEKAYKRCADLFDLKKNIREIEGLIVETSRSRSEAGNHT